MRALLSKVLVSLFLSFFSLASVADSFPAASDFVYKPGWFQGGSWNLSDRKLDDGYQINSTLHWAIYSPLQSTFSPNAKLTVRIRAYHCDAHSRPI